jgi:hypothetical protein
MHRSAYTPPDLENTAPTLATILPRYKLQAKDHLVYKPRVVKDVSKSVYTGIASVLPYKGCNASPVMRLIWRVAFFQESAEFGPRKPFWFLRSSLTLCTKGDIQRII